MQENRVSFDYTTRELQKILLDQNNVIFQGQEISLKTLTDDKFIEAMDSETIVKLNNSKKINIGRNLPISLGYDELYYIERNVTFEKIKSPNAIFADRIKIQETIKESELVQDLKKHRVVIISDAVGTGKSTVLTNLSVNIKKHFPTNWVIKIELLNCNQKFLRKICKSNFKISPTDTDLIADFLIYLLETSVDNILLTDLEHKIFRYMLDKGEQIVLLFDGLEDINLDYKDILGLVNFLQTLIHSDKIKKIFLTTQKDMGHRIGSKLNKSVYNINQFTKEDQVNFLIKYWSKEIGNAHSLIETLKIYAVNLVRQFFDAKNNYHTQFTAEPLQMKMLADIFIKDAEEFINSANMIPQIPEAFNIHELYERFFDINLSMETSLNDNDHQILAVYSFFNNDFLKVIFSNFSKEIERIQMLINYIRNCDKNIEIVVGISFHDKPQFIHETFVEYFVAKYLFNVIQERYQTDFVNFVLVNIFVTSRFEGIRVFLGSMLDKNPLKREILDIYGFNLNRIWLTDKVKLWCWLPIFHISCNNFGVFKLLFDSLANFDATLKKLVNISANYFDQTCLHLSVKYENIRIVQLLIPKVSNINVYSRCGESAIFHVAGHKNLKIFELLKKSGCRVDMPINSCTLLHRAAKAGNEELCRILIDESKLDINAMDYNGQTPFLAACESGNLNVVKLLVEKGADIANDRNSYNACLDKTAYSGSEELYEWLLRELNFDVNGKDHVSRTPLYFACKMGRFNIVKMLIDKGADVNCITDLGDTVIHSAAYSGNEDLLKWLLEKFNLDVNVKNKTGLTPLHVASGEGELGIIKYLLTEFILDVDVVENDAGYTPLHIACRKGRFGMVKFLLERGADIHKKTNNGQTVLHSATFDFRNEELYEWLLDGFDLDVNAETESGWTPLHVASDNGQFNKVKLLVRRGADLYRTTNYGNTVFSLAKSGNQEMYKWLVEKRRLEEKDSLDENQTLNAKSHIIKRSKCVIV